ncbi:MAG TPA: VLRF1 family aeRF1-type release factor [Candidatus Binatia bacterium]
MITQDDVTALLERKGAPDSPVLSVYLDIDQSKAANLERRFETRLSDMLRSIAAGLDEKRAAHFAGDAERVRRFVADLEPRGKGWTCFADDSARFFWERALQVPVQDQARWDETPYLAPLIKILDEYERYGVVLVDKARARLFTVFIGEIEERYDPLEELAPAEVARVKNTGTDHMLSERQFQDKAEMHVHRHLKRVASTVEKIIGSHALDRLLLAGPVEAASELRGLLSKRARARVAARLALPVESSPGEVLEATLRVEREVERQAEKQIVDELIAADGHHPVAHGLKRTLRALAERRIWQLVYAEGFGGPGGRCTNCGLLLDRAGGACDYCGGAVRPVDNLLEPMVESVLESDGKVEEVEGEAAERLRPVGGVGAFLRF